MPTTPRTRRGKLAFYEAHLAPWGEHRAAIGLDDEQVGELAARLEATRAALLAAEEARAAARAATAAFRAEAAALAELGSGMIASIRVTADRAEATGGDPADVYALAQIPAPKRRGRAPAPGTPYALRAELLADGALALVWKCDNPRGPSGTMYEIHRSLDGGPFAFLGLAGERRATDRTLPAGTASVVYRITAARSTRRGEPAQFIVNLGVADAEARESGNLKLAV